jgi:SAM-dependent methyltransferase
MGDAPWYTTLFGEDYWRIYSHLTPERTVQEVEGTVNLLALPPGSAILDLCCGHGRHTIPLAERGYRMTGLDLSEIFLRRARADAETHGIQIRWVHSDMREIPFENEFDAVINLFTSFGYLESEDNDQQVLRQVHKSLKPGGLFLLEMIHRESLMRRYAPSSVTRHDDGLLILEEHRFDLLASRNEVRVTLLYPDGRRTEYRHAVRVYSLTELARMLEAAGLVVQAHYGGLDGSRLTMDSRRLVVLSRKDG